MRTVEYARAMGRAARERVGGPPAGLLERLRAYLRAEHRVTVLPMSAVQMKGSRAAINAETMALLYDASLADAEVLMLLAHELGHLVLHRRLGDVETETDLLLASAYGAAGPHATARYSSRTYEESQATAFALDFVAPSDAVWAGWHAECHSTGRLAEQFGCSADIIRAQLAHALHAVALGGTVPSASRKDVPFPAAQLAAAQFTGAPAIVDAGPGTGKTATVIRRIQCLLQEHGARPSEILALTFSNEAAQELSERIAAQFGEDVADEINVRTFHGFGVEFLHQHGHLVGLSERFELLDEERQIDVVNALLGTVPCDDLIDLRVPRETAARVVEHINFCKQRLYDVDVLGESQFAQLFRAYEAERLRDERRAQRIDFADLIALPIRILEQRADVRAAYAARFPWVIVDEFQDVTRATSRLLRALCGPSNPPWVVGDARQSIYQFLGAAPENVTAFAEDFENARVFALDVNYRSCEPVVSAANQLAALLENLENVNDAATESVRWRAGTPIAPLGDCPVTVAEAATDAAEANGVATHVRDWIERDGVQAGDIAVLCRRHADVRRVILELSRRGIKAQASGVLTAEGAAGDLAAMVTLADAPIASAPRVVYAVGRGRRTSDELNGVVADLLKDLRGDRGWGGEAGELSLEIGEVHEMLHRERECADGFSALAMLLFDHGAYLRRILAMPDSAERSMALVEIVSALSLATAYRATHMNTPPAVARIGFAEALRTRLTKTLPIPLSPRPRTDAVHVMTCHASKGLEFPCVVVVGQTVPDIDPKWSWLPEAIRPDKSREEAQANALLFVGVTRAKRSVLVSFPKRATAGTRRTEKAVVPLLTRWRESFGIATTEWSDGDAPETRISAGNIWDVPLKRDVKANALEDSICPLLTYVETHAGVRFPTAVRELYPAWFAAVRSTLRAVVAFAASHGAPASEEDARLMFASEWPADRVGDHPHAALYRDAGERMVVGFARAFEPMTRDGVLELEPDVVLPFGDGLNVRLDLIAHYRRRDGSRVAIAFRPERLGGDESSLNWSDLSDSKRAALAFFEYVRPGSVPFVFSGADGRIYGYRWSKNKKSLPTLGAGFEARRVAMAGGDFSADVTRRQCDRCRVRIGCPQWVGR
ncbi:MAG TPA: UvrD-helicase domain-containing protein [Gemmatimonadaceae bacterium]|nr:UvrD-helicase domain-containing protein [Gemmatimonadaceae bacterium]